jgi:tryptophan-rich sensory protein
MRRPIVTVAFLAAVLGGGVLIGTITRPDDWYATLAKPSFNPPNWVFAPVWTALYLMIAVAGARTYERGSSAAFTLWLVQLALNFAWTPLFFGLHRPVAALAVIVALLVAIVAFIAIRWSADRVSALLFVPYAAWVAFATLLNASIAKLN